MKFVLAKSLKTKQNMNPDKFSNMKFILKQNFRSNISNYINISLNATNGL